MKTYNIYVNDYTQDIKLVPEGFSFTAFFAGIFWSCYHRLFLLTIIVLVIYFGLSKAMQLQYISLDGCLVWQLLLQIIMGCYGADLIQYHLKKNNYYLKNIIIAADSQAAMQRHFTELQST